MQVFDLFNTDYERRISEGAVDRLEQRRIDDLNMKMDELAHRVKSTSNPEHKKSLLKAFLDAKEERDSYYKIKEGEVTRTATGIKHRSTDAYGGTPKEKDPLDKLDKSTTNSLEKSMGVRFDRQKKYQGGLDLDEGSMKHMMHKDAEHMSREAFCEKYGDEHGEFWDNIMGELDEGKWNYPDYMTQKANQDDEAELGISGRNKDRRKEWRKKQKAQAHKELMTGKKKEQSVDEAGIGQDIVNKSEKIARATPPTKAGAVASTVKNAAKWLAGKGGPGKEGPTYEGANDIADRGEYDQEGDMAKDNIHTIVRNARELESILGDNDNLPEWVQDKLANIKGMMNAVSEYMQTQHERDHEESVTIAEKLKGLPSKKLGSARDLGKSVRKFRAQRGLEEAGTADQWSKEGEWKSIPKAKSGKPADPRGEVTHLSDVARREAERKADQKKNSEEVDEGFQDFNKVEPYAVCLAGKPIKKFDYYEEARRFHDNWKKKLYNQGEKEKADKITLMPLNLDEVRDPWNEKHFGPVEVVQKVFKVKADNGKSYNIKAATEQAAKETLQKHAPDANIVSIKFVSNVMNEAGDRVDPILYKALDRMQPGIAGQGQPGDDLFSAARTALATEWGLMALRSEYATATAYTRQLIDLYLAKHGVKESQTDYSKRRQRERDVDAGKPVTKPRQSKMTDYQKKRAQDRKDMELGEDQDTSGVESAILRRIMVAHKDWLMKFGPQKVMQAAEEVAYNVGDVDEIGTSDVSAYVHEVGQILGVDQ